MSMRAQVRLFAVLDNSDPGACDGVCGYSELSPADSPVMLCVECPLRFFAFETIPVPVLLCVLV